MSNRMIQMLAASFMAALTIGISQPLMAQETPAAPAAVKTQEKTKTMPFRGKVTEVNKTEQTVTLSGKEKPRVFKVNPKTRITKDGKVATLDDVLVGDLARGQARLVDQGQPELISLQLGPKADASQKTPAKEASGEM